MCIDINQVTQQNYTQIQCILGYPNTFGLEVVRIIVAKCKYQHHHYTLSVLLALALALMGRTSNIQAAYRWLKYRSHYKMATLL